MPTMYKGCMGFSFSRGEEGTTFLKSKEKYSNAYLIRKLDQVNCPLMTNKEAIEYLNNLHITKIKYYHHVSICYFIFPFGFAII